jgi:hypothetical protein
MATENLTFLAGRKALVTVREKGLTPDMVKVIAGAAGGPKGLVLTSLDRAIFASWLKDRTAPLFLLGSSIGAWRFAAVSRIRAAEVIEELEEAIIRQRYEATPSREAVSRGSLKILDRLLEGSGSSEVMEHPYLRLSILAARCKWPVASDNKVLLGIGLMDAALYNAMHRAGLSFFFERTLFYDPREVPPFFHMKGLPMNQVALTERNLKPALLATASMPLLMTGVRNIPGAPPGVYRDGGVLDHDLDVPFLRGGEGIVLFPHYTDRLVPGWFDQRLPWRGSALSNLENVLLVTPRSPFMERLPFGRLPEKWDFLLFRGRDDERIACWRRAMEESRILGEEFLATVESGRIRERVRPIPESRRRN